MLRPLKIYETDNDGNVKIGPDGKAVLVGRVLPGGHVENSRPKTERELSQGDRAMLEHSILYDKEKQSRDDQAVLATEHLRAAAESSRNRRS